MSGACAMSSSTGAAWTRPRGDRHQLGAGREGGRHAGRVRQLRQLRPRPPAAGRPARFVEPPADRVRAAAQHQQLGAAVAVEVRHRRAEVAGRAPVRDRGPVGPPLDAAVGAEAEADAVVPGHDRDQLRAPVAVEVGDRHVAARAGRLRDRAPAAPAAAHGAVLAQIAPDPIVAAAERDRRPPAVQLSDRQAGGRRAPPARNVVPRAPAVGSERAADAVPPARQHHEVAARDGRADGIPRRPFRDRREPGRHAAGP